MENTLKMAISTRNLRKVFGEITAVKDVSLNINYGEIYALLGPNGAGKTTIFSLIAGIYSSTTGDIFLDGEPMTPDARHLKARLGIVPQEITLFEDLSPLENLLYFAGLYRLNGKEAHKRAVELLDWMELMEKSKTPVKKLSGGMKRRVNFICGIIHHPSILLLDEPTVGIDVQTRLMILEKTRELGRRGMAILYTTHYMEEAEKISDRVGILDHGRLLVEGTLVELHKHIHSQVAVALTGEFTPEESKQALAEFPFSHQVLLSKPGHLVVSLEDPQKAMDLLEFIRRRLIIVECSLRPPSLENLFVQLTGRELRE